MYWDARGWRLRVPGRRASSSDTLSHDPNPRVCQPSTLNPGGGAGIRRLGDHMAHFPRRKPSLQVEWVQRSRPAWLPASYRITSPYPPGSGGNAGGGDEYFLPRDFPRKRVRLVFPPRSNVGYQGVVPVDARANNDFSIWLHPFKHIAMGVPSYSIGTDKLRCPFGCAFWLRWEAWCFVGEWWHLVKVLQEIPKQKEKNNKKLALLNGRDGTSPENPDLVFLVISNVKRRIFC